MVAIADTVPISTSIYLFHISISHIVRFSFSYSDDATVLTNGLSVKYIFTPQQKYKIPKDKTWKCGSLPLPPAISIIPAWNIHTPEPSQAHDKEHWPLLLRMMEWGCRRILRLRCHRRATATVLNCHPLDFPSCLENKSLCFDPLFCVFSATWAESNSNPYGIHVPTYSGSVNRYTYLYVCASMTSPDWNTMSHVTQSAHWNSL